MIFGWLIAATAASTMLELLTRQCPRCGRKQVIPKEKLTAHVSCERCGASVPPKPAPRR